MARVTDTSDPTLAHNGVKGMKWGKRKAKSSSSDSTSKSGNKATPFAKNPNKAPPSAKGVTDLTPKHVKRIPDAELRQRINRMQMETQYRELTEGKSSPDKSKIKQAAENFEKGHKVVKGLLAVAKTAQTIYKLYDSNEVRFLRGVEPKDTKKK